MRQPRQSVARSAVLWGLTAAVMMGLTSCHSTTHMPAPPTLEQSPSPPALPRLPRPGPQPEIAVPVPERTTLGKGIALWHVPTPHVPLVSVNLVIRVGSADDPRGRAGLASITSAMLDEGAGDRDAIQLADDLDLLGASFAVSTDRETSHFSLQVLRKNLEPALDIFADVLLRPKFTVKDWERTRALRLNQLQQARADPNTVAGQITYRVIFGEDHPYAHPPSGYKDSLQAISLDEVKAFYRRWWRPRDAVIVSAGAISTDELKNLLERRLRGWEDSGDARRRGIPSYPGVRRPRLVVVHRPSAAQTVVRVVNRGISRSDPAYVPLSVLNHVFGGAFTSRLMQNLREDHAFTYGAGSNFSRMRGRGLYLSGTSVKTQVTGASLQELAKEYRRMRSSGITDAELSKARAGLRNGVVEQLQTVAGTAGLFVSRVRSGLPPTGIEADLDRIARVDRDTVASVAEEFIRWDDAVVFLVGDVDAIRAQIDAVKESLGSAEITLIDEEGKPIED